MVAFPVTTSPFMILVLKSLAKSAFKPVLLRRRYWARRLRSSARTFAARGDKVTD